MYFEIYEQFFSFRFIYMLQNTGNSVLRLFNLFQNWSTEASLHNLRVLVFKNSLIDLSLNMICNINVNQSCLLVTCSFIEYDFTNQTLNMIKLCIMIIHETDSGIVLLCQKKNHVLSRIRCFLCIHQLKSSSLLFFRSESSSRPAKCESETKSES